MKLDYSLLRTIHRILRQKADLSERIEKGPRKVVVAENAEKQFLVEVDEAKQSKIKMKMAADEKQLQLSDREARIEELKKKLNTAASNREYQLLTDQIAADEQANSVLSDEILEMLERLDVLDQSHKTSEQNLAQAKAETEKIRQRVQGEMDKLNGELESVLAELKENESKLKGEVAAEYHRLVPTRGEEVFAETDMQTCGQCYTKLTTQTMSELMMKATVYCQTCGSLLYVAENHAATN